MNHDRANALVDTLPADADVNRELILELIRVGERVVGLETLCIQVSERSVPVTSEWERELVALCVDSRVAQRFIDLVA